GHLAGRPALDIVPAGLLPPRARALPPVPATVPGEARRRPPSRPPEFLWRPRPSRRCTILRGLSRPAAQGRVGRLFKAPVRRTSGGASLSVALHPPRCHRQQSLDHFRQAGRHLQVEGLPHRRTRSIQAHDARHRRGHPPIPHPRATKRLPPHPPLRPCPPKHSAPTTCHPRATCPP